MRRAGVLILVLLGLSFVLVVLDQVVGLGIVKGAAVWLFTPVERGINQSGEEATSFWERWRKAGQLQDENEQLKEMVDTLTTENRRYQEVLRENEEYRQLLGLSERYPDLEQVPAEVIGVDPTGLRQVIRISWASFTDDKIEVRVGMAVTSPAGLVGRIIEVYPNSADVLLITDISSSVSAVVQNDERPSGVVDGQWQVGTRLVMRYLPQGSTIQEGDWVVTSGLAMPPFENAAFPPAIPIGQVLKVEKSTGMHQEVELIPVVDFDHLKWVMIVLGTK